ncbi:Protein POLLEN DEFECTIVE IN GUIDANCE 1, partial [Mucuna pruriens]
MYRKIIVMIPILLRTVLDRIRKVNMRHSGAVLTEEPPQSQASSSNSLPHRKKKRKCRGTATSTSVSSETSYANGPDQLHTHIHRATVACEEKPKPEQSRATVGDHGFRFGELRQRGVSAGDSFDDSAVTAVDDGYAKEVSSVGVATSETEESLKLKRVLANDSICEYNLTTKSPVTYFSEKVYLGNSVWSTTIIGNEKGRERVYDTIFRLPWRCELVFGILSFSSLKKKINKMELYSQFTMPSMRMLQCLDAVFFLHNHWIRINIEVLGKGCNLKLSICWFLCLLQFISVIINCHANKDSDDHLEASENKVHHLSSIFFSYSALMEFKRPSTFELSDFGCFLIMACGVTVLQQIDISFIYHIIRGQATIKLYVIYNVLEIFDKLCQNFIGDVLQMLFHSAEQLARCPPETESTRFWIWRFISDQVLAVVTSNILFLWAITLSACIVSHYNALPALLVSNNFAEIKSYVFKGYSKDNVHSMVYSDSIERFHISAFILFVLAQNILEAEGPWFESFIINILLIYLFEMAIDVIKHSFIAKFNNITPIAYSEFLEVLCKQTLHMQTEDVKKKLTFVPLAPACVVIRVLAPVYAANLPYNSLPWRLSWILNNLHYAHKPQGSNRYDSTEACQMLH